MASATGIPERSLSSVEVTGTPTGETEPLLGRTGDAAQVQGQPFLHNLTLGKGNCRY